MGFAYSLIFDNDLRLKDWLEAENNEEQARVGNTYSKFLRLNYILIDRRGIERNEVKLVQ